MRTFGKWLGRLLLLIVIAVAAFLTFAPGYVESGRNAVAEHDPFVISDTAETLHADLLIGDWHADPTLWKRDLSKRANRGHTDIPRLIDGNVAIQVFTAVTKSPAGQNNEQNSADAFDNITPLAIGQLWPPRTWGSLVERALFQGEKLEDLVNTSDGQFRLVLDRESREQLLDDRAAGAPLVGGIFGIEGGHALEGDISNLDRLEEQGLRLVGLHHFFDNELGGSLHGISNAGLTDFGREVVTEVVKRGMILDVAHSSPQVVKEVIEMTDIPLVLSHGGIYSHCSTARNLPDDLMQDLAATGGVIGIGFWDSASCATSPDGVAASIKAAVDLLGEDHVSLGSDFDGSVQTGFDASELAAVTDALLRAGFTETQIRKIMGENMIRVLRERLAN